MGKHKKFLKSEKAKVKLKGNKLKGPQNVTKTDFKVKKIVLTEQLKNVQELEKGTRKIHSVQDCLSRLKNSTSAEAISNLKEIILYQEDDVQKNLEMIIKIVANFSLSIEKGDRVECFRILNIICSQKNRLNLEPFFSILLTYLKCAMTHIKPSIQEDSLSMLDILMKHFPQLVVAEKDDILIPYLDMMSKTKNESSQERSITLHSSNKIMSIKWRKTILEQLVLLLKCLNNEKRKNDEISSRSAKDIIVSEKQEYLCNPYNFYNSPLSISLKNDNSKLNNSQTSNAKKYINMIMPLMFETWVELRDSTATNSISNDSSIVLKLVMDVTTELFAFISESEDAKNQFLSQYQDRFEKQILNNFPYVQNEKGKKTQESGGEKCIYQNLSIANLYLSFSIKNQQRFRKYRERIFSFIEDQISSWKTKDLEFNVKIKQFIHSLFTEKNLKKIFAIESKKLFMELVKSCDTNHMSFDTKLKLVCKIIENYEGDLCHDNIITQMVNILTVKEYIPMHLVKTLLVLAKKGNTLLMKCIEDRALDIVNNLQKVKIADENIKRNIVNLLYWINSKEVIESLKEIAKTNNDLILNDVCEMALLK